MAPRRRQSKAFNSLDDEQFAEYRLRCLPRELGGRGHTLKGILNWLAACGLESSLAAVGRDAEHFRRVEEKLRRMAMIGRASREIMAAANEGGAVAAAQSAATQMLTQLVSDFLLAEDTLRMEDVPKISKLGQMLARLQAAEISRYKAEVERQARCAADKVKALAGESTGNVKAQLATLADEILGVGR